MEVYASLHNQKEDNNQSKINKPPKVPESQIAWNSANQGIKEKTRTTRLARWDHAGWLKNCGQAAALGVGLSADSMGYTGGADLRGKLRLRADCGILIGLPQWEKLPVSQECPSESAPEPSRWAALFPLWPLSKRQPRSAARRVALLGWMLKVPPPYNFTGVLRWRSRAQMKEQSKTLERELMDGV